MRPSNQLVFLLGAAILGSCTALPDLPDSQQLSLSNVVKGVECELIDATAELYKRRPTLDKYGVGLKLTVIADNFKEFAPSFASISPIARPAEIAFGTVTSLIGTVSVDARGDFTGQSRRTVALELGYTFKAIRQAKCEPVYVGSNPLESNLGIFEALSRPLETSNIGLPLRVGTTIQFVVTAEGRVTPGLALVRFNGPSSIGPSGMFLGRRTDDHTLDISVTPLPGS